MNDDWRLQITLDDSGIAGETADLLRSAELSLDLKGDVGEQVAVSHEGETLFLYAGERDPLDRAQTAIRKFLDEKGWQAELELRRWHHDADAWEDPDKPLPSSAPEREAEHEELMATEDAETAARGGRAEFEVRVQFHSHKEARKFAKQLEEEGLEPVRRWRYMVVGAADEDAAKTLADRIRAEAPADSEVTAEYSLHELWNERPPNPNFWLGGLGDG
ncbi:MAG TPA: hypothetical protein VHZ54_02905 [Solirubrobacterales bacterium]|jgi:hypothetical protein|nr:hypothetical protein [Solirubrobacterales bacterium]